MVILTKKDHSFTLTPIVNKDYGEDGSALLSVLVILEVAQIFFSAVVLTILTATRINKANLDMKAWKFRGNNVNRSYYRVG